MWNYDEFFVEKYILAYKELKKIFKKMNQDFSNKEDVNPIENMKFRIKKMASLKEKLFMRNLEFTPENIDNNIRDVVGCRIVCSFLSDIEKIKKEIIELDKKGILKIVNIKDYVKNPKENGYTSLHMIVSIPVRLSNKKKEYVNAEIQIRTVAMDMICSLEHKLAYKKKESSEEINEIVKHIFNFCKNIDNDLDNLVKVTINQKYEKTNKTIIGLDKVKVKYTMALESILDKLKKVYENYDKSDIVNPIEHFKGRIKPDSEIIRKLVEKNLDINIDNIVNYINDFAGCRVVCSFLSDIDILKNEIKNMEQKGLLTILKEKDYINNPKKSGYRGYHYLVNIPIYIPNEGVKNVKVEIQLRTVAMEMWASLEEKICYHKTTDNYIKDELVRLSHVTEVLDNNINDVVLEYGKINKGKVRERKKNNV